jgi:hypothetical protein
MVYIFSFGVGFFALYGASVMLVRAVNPTLPNGIIFAQMMPQGYSACDYNGNGCEVPQIVNASVSYTPVEGVLTSAFASGNTDINVLTKDLIVSTNPQPKATDYKCKVEVKSKIISSSYVTINDSLGNQTPNYDPTTGCSLIIKKINRSNTRMLDVKISILKQSDSSLVQVINSGYALR